MIIVVNALECLTCEITVKYHVILALSHIQASCFGHAHVLQMGMPCQQVTTASLELIPTYKL
jgi:hypothetical protein